MFKPIKLVLNNFRAFRGEHTLVFPTVPGLYHIQGRNEAEPRLGPNGAGKSTMLDAFYWCLYGKTLRGLRGGDVLTRGEASAFVELTLEIADEIVTVRREQSPNKLTLDDTLVEQEALTKALRITEEAFKYCVILPQFGDSFFERKPSEKLNLFSEILNLDYWLDKSKAASASSADMDIGLGKLEQRIDNTEATIENLTAELTTLSIKEKSYEDEKKVVVEKLRGQLVELRQQLQAKKEDMIRAAREIKLLDQEKALKIDELGRLNAKKADYLKQREEQAGDIAYTKGQIEAAEINLKKLRGLGATCPNCLQKVDASHLKRERAELASKLVTLNDELRAFESEAVSSKKFINKLWTDISDVDEEIKAVVKEISEIAKVQAADLTSVELGAKQETALIEAINTEKARTNPYTGLLQEKRGKLTLANQEATSLVVESEALQMKFEATSYWVQGFKRVRLFLIEETLKTFEIEVNSSLTSLGLDDWAVHFDVERENKSGGVTKGFTVIVRNKAGGDSFKLEEWSGGEGQRIQLAGDLGLANLIMLQAGLDSRFEAFDEPSAHLSQEGLLDLAETLHQRAVSDGKIIFMIDHHAIEFGEFAGVINVVKGGNGAHFQ